jgi:AcrR family transcriptional regulator
MPKPKNTQSYELIANAAYYLFLEKGYVSTTYQDIEDLCGIKRTMIQHYFPKKTLLALSFFEKLISEITEYIIQNNIKSENKYLNMFLIGQIHFSFLLKDEKTKTFTSDIISSRELTDEVLTFDYNWGIKYLDVKIEQQNIKLLDDIISTMGGFYELVYQCLKDNREINVPYQLGKVIISIMETLGYSYEYAKNIISNNSFHSTDFIKTNQFLVEKICILDSSRIYDLS